ncbi:MAG: winged helix-turn-helix domain-containing protein [Candidatus Limnocylindrales bacterium]
MDISPTTARRFILGRQGLWPGRRWRGLTGTERAMRAMEHLQLDPLAIMARAQDLMLASRVIDYRPDDWATLTYGQRKFFDWGGWLAVRPMDELPYWRVLMRRERENGHWRTFEREHHAAIAEMRNVLRDRGMVANRDFAMSSRARTDSYRGRKDSALALYYLWRVGEAMVHHRERFERVYAPTEAVAPAAFLDEADDAEADDFFRRKQVAAEGLTRFLGIGREERAATMAWRDTAVASGDLIELKVDGWKARTWALGEDAATIRSLEAGQIPRGWKALETTTQDEATFLAPLDPVSARGRARTLFDFDYTWEVYTPAAKRRYGYYTLPVLWGDRLVARFDARFDRPSRTLVLLGLWLEDDTLAADEAFVDAFARGMTRFIAFLGADTIDATAVPQTAIRARLERAHRGA